MNGEVFWCHMLSDTTAWITPLLIFLRWSLKPTELRNSYKPSGKLCFQFIQLLSISSLSFSHKELTTNCFPECFMTWSDGGDNDSLKMHSQAKVTVLVRLRCCSRLSEKKRMLTGKKAFPQLTISNVSVRSPWLHYFQPQAEAEHNGQSINSSCSSAGDVCLHPTRANYTSFVTYFIQLSLTPQRLQNLLNSIFQMEPRIEHRSLSGRDSLWGGFHV